MPQTIRTESGSGGLPYSVKRHGLIRLAASPVQLADAAYVQPVTAPLTTQGRRALVVDDNADAADTFAMMLGLSGHETRMAYGGLEALTLARDFRPDVIFLDLGMPGMSGLEVARKMRADPALAHVLLVAVTGWGADEDRKKSKEAGFDIHLTKPVKFESIEEVMKTPSRAH